MILSINNIGKVYNRYRDIIIISSFYDYCYEYLYASTHNLGAIAPEIY